MTKKTKENNSLTTKEELVTEEETTTSRTRPSRRKVYARLKESDIPDDLRAHFHKKGYGLRFIRWAIHGEIDRRYLHRRQEQDGYEFVTKDELPNGQSSSLQVVDGMLTNGSDLCLMKVDLDFQKSRKEYFDGVADAEVDSVDIHTSGALKRKGLRNTGSKSKVMLKEPTFQD